jgi:RimJ/RimL family protein N-acetyltransferase
MSQAMQIRKVTLDDAEMLLFWRNDPITRQMSRDQGEVTLDKHVIWLERSIQADTRLLYIVGDKYGVVRFDDSAHGEWEVSITLNPAHRGKGLSKPILAKAMEQFWSIHHNANIVAFIKPENDPSLRLFRSCGFMDRGTHDGLIYMLAIPKYEQTAMADRLPRFWGELQRLPRPNKFAAELELGKTLDHIAATLLRHGYAVVPLMPPEEAVNAADLTHRASTRAAETATSTIEPTVHMKSVYQTILRGAAVVRPPIRDSLDTRNT